MEKTALPRWNGHNGLGKTQAHPGGGVDGMAIFAVSSRWNGHNGLGNSQIHLGGGVYGVASFAVLSRVGFSERKF